MFKNGTEIHTYFNGFRSRVKQGRRYSAIIKKFSLD